MVEEPAILGRKHRFDEMRRNVLVGNIGAPHAALGDEFAAARENGEVGRQMQDHGLARIWHDRGEIGGNGDERDGTPADGDDDPGNEAQQRAVRAAPWLGERRLGNDPDDGSPDGAPSLAQKPEDQAVEELPNAGSEEAQMGGSCRPITHYELCAPPATQQAHTTPHKSPGRVPYKPASIL